MDATSSADLVHTQVHPRRPWRTQGPRPSVRGSKGRRRKKRQLLQAPDIRPDPRKSGAHHRRHPKLNQVSLDIRPQARTSGPSRAAAHPAQLPEIRRPITEAGPCQPGHPAPAPGHPASREGPDIRPVARTSGPVCLRTVKGRSPCTPSLP